VGKLKVSRIPTVEESLAESTKPEVGRSAKMRNLQWIIGGIVVTLAAIGILSSTATREVQDEQKLAEQNRLNRLKQSQIGTPVNIDEINKAIDAQKDMEEEAQRREDNAIPGSLGGATKSKRNVKTGIQGDSQKPLVPPLPNVPESGRPYPGTMPPLPSERELEAKKANDLALRDEQIRAAGIMAITDTGVALRGAPNTSTQKPGGGVDQQYLGGLNNQMADAKARLAQAKTGGPQEEMFKNYQASQGQAGVAPNRTSAGGYGSGGYQGNPTADSNSRWLDSQGRSTNSRVLTAERPAAAHVVGQGAVIPAVLITELNSDMPGQLTAVVAMDIYDSIYGDQLMIPKGSRLVGLYNNDVRVGQERVIAAFQRLVLPNGNSVDLMGMSSADAQGRGGLLGDVDNHFFKMFAASFMTAGLAQLFQKDSTSNTVVVNGTAGNPGVTAAGQILSDISKTINQRNVNIPPTITIKQGHKFNVIVNKDMALSPYRM
jgi:type IV secretion system protein VirB10